jgi:DNA polymerase-3 subunit epsilon
MSIGQRRHARGRMNRSNSYYGDQQSKRALTARSFVALDFETATRSLGSACALGVVRVEDDRIVASERYLIRPPSSRFEFTRLHGIAWADVRNAPVFDAIWPQVQRLLEGASFIAAHHAAFDHAVLRTCCKRHRIGMPMLPFLCTVELARRTWNLRSASLPAVCGFLAIPLRHHDPLSDAEACARIVLIARSFKDCGVLDP